MEILIFAVIVYLMIGDIAKGMQMQKAKQAKVRAKRKNS